MNDQKMSRLITTLRWLVYLVMAIQVISAAMFLTGDDKMHLSINGEIWSQSFSVFGLADQIFLFVVLSLQTVVYLWGLYYVTQLCRLFDRGVIFAGETITCFKKIALVLILIAVFESVLGPMLISYLWIRDIISGPIEMGPAYLLNALDIQVLLAGILFFIISKIMEIGLEQKNESELTI